MRVLLITSRFPLPPHRGNQVRSLEWLDALGDQHQVGLVAPAGTDPDLVPRIEGSGVTTYLHRSTTGAALAGAARSFFLQRQPLQEGLYHTAAARDALRRALCDGPWQVAVVQMVRCAWAAQLLAEEAPGLPLLFDAIDAMGQHYQRSLADYRLPLHPAVRLEGARCQVRERWLVRRSAVTTAVSRRDLDALACPAGCGRVVPVAGREMPAAPARATGTAPIVLLSGNLGYRPTITGALWFAREVWPQLRQQVPGIRWLLAGARPPLVMRRLARLPGVEVHGDVDELATYLQSASLVIAPMPTGSGVPMKVLEAWAVGVPAVAAPWTAAGLEGNGRGLVVAGNAEEWVRAVTSLLYDRTLAERLIREGREIWDRWYHPQRVREMVRAAIGAAASADTASVTRGDEEGA